MRFSRPFPLLSLAAGVGLLAVPVSAADPETSSKDSGTTKNTPTSSEATQSSSSQPTEKTSQQKTTQQTTTSDPTTTSQTQPTTTSQPPSTTSSEAPTSSSSSSSSSSSPDPTTSSSAPSTSSTQPATTSFTSTVAITGATSGSSTINTDVPLISGVFVAATVPPTANAPFMKQSTLPEGTVFIIVGAILGFLAMAVVLWRGLVVWSLHRSINRAATQQSVSAAKSSFKTPPAPFYQFKDRESTISLGGMGPRSGRKGARPSTATGLANQSLFFSPTAGATGLANPGNRASSYLPAGYYAAGASQLGNGQGMAHVGTPNPGISLSNLGPARDGYAKTRSVGPSPPGSPYINAIPSSSTLNLSQAPGDQRAPSAYLDDLFDSEGGPQVPGHRRVQSGARSPGRF